MQDPHITRLLEEKPVSHLSAAALEAIEAHITACTDCLRAYRGARISETLIEARKAERQEVSPFFKTRVMAAIREKRLSPELPAWVRLWQAAGSLVLTLASVVLILIGLTIFNSPLDGPTMPEAMTTQNIYSPDEVVLGQDDAADEAVGYDQVLGTMYDTEDGDGN